MVTPRDRWKQELREFKERLRHNVLASLKSYIEVCEADNDEEYWNDEWGMNAKEAFKDFIGYMNDWARDDNDVKIKGITE